MHSHVQFKDHTISNYGNQLITVSSADETAGNGVKSIFCVIFFNPPSHPFCIPRGTHANDGLFPGAGIGFTRRTVQLVVVNKQPVGHIDVSVSHS